jgi:bacterioferritin (cytochrome b1)
MRLNAWNWENTKVVETLNKILSTEIGDIEQNIKFIEFAKDNYCSVFKNT